MGVQAAWILMGVAVLAVIVAARDSWMRVQLRSAISDEAVEAAFAEKSGVGTGVNLASVSSSSSGSSVAPETHGLDLSLNARLSLVLLLVILAWALMQAGSRVSVLLGPGYGSSSVAFWVWRWIGIAALVLLAVVVSRTFAPAYTLEEIGLGGDTSVEGAFGGTGPSERGAYWYMLGAALVCALALLGFSSASASASSTSGQNEGLGAAVVPLAMVLVAIVVNDMYSSDRVLSSSLFASAVVSIALMGVLVSYRAPVWLAALIGAGAMVSGSRAA